MTSYHRRPDPGEQTFEQQQRAALDAARAQGLEAQPGRSPAVDAVVRAATGDGVPSARTVARIEYLAEDWPELAGALAALLHAEGVEVPARWLSMGATSTPAPSATLVTSRDAPPLDATLITPDRGDAPPFAAGLVAERPPHER